MQTVADASSLLANIVMPWNTTQMQRVLDHWRQRRGGATPAERYAAQILPSAVAEKMRVGTA